MGFEVYDCRRDIRNILARPQIRARFCRLELGTGSLDAWQTSTVADGWNGLAPRAGSVNAAY